MQQNAKSPSAALSRAQLALCTIALGGICLWAALAHGRTEASAAVRVESAAPERVAKDVSQAAWQLDLNTATQAELEVLPGIGPRRAGAIVRERLKRGAYKSVWDLSEVPGLSRAMIQRLETLVTVRPRLP